MGLRAVERLQRESNCDLRDCVALIFVSPSIVSRSLARDYLDEQQAWLRSTQHAAREFARRLGVSAEHVYGINWGLVVTVKPFRSFSGISSRRYASGRTNSS